MPDSPLKTRLREDLTAAMRSRDELRRSTLRMVLTALSAAEVSGTSARDLSEDEVLAVVRAETKKRRDSATVYTEAGREDGAQRAEREGAEADVLEAYLPVQLDDDALSTAVAAEVAAAAADGQSGPRAMGAVMGRLRPKVGQLVDGGRLAAEVKRQLVG